jgi:hypothetical protein
LRPKNTSGKFRNGTSGILEITSEKFCPAAIAIRHTFDYTRQRLRCSGGAQRNRTGESPDEPAPRVGLTRMNEDRMTKNITLKDCDKDRAEMLVAEIDKFRCWLEGYHAGSSIKHPFSHIAGEDALRQMQAILKDSIR